MGIKILGAMLLSIFMVGSTLNNVSGALGNNQTVADVAENFDSKTNDNDKKKDGIDEKEDSSKDLVSCESNKSNSSKFKSNLVLGGIGVACLTGGIALGIKAIGNEEKEESTSRTVAQNEGEEKGYKQDPNDPVDETTSEEETNVEGESKNTNKVGVALLILSIVILASCVIFSCCCGCCCAGCTRNPISSIKDGCGTCYDLLCCRWCHCKL